MNARQFLDVADDLTGGTREGDWRSAASRAYYAAFHAARQLLRRCGFDVPQAEAAHAYLWLRLQNRGHPDLRHAGQELQDLRKDRNLADYDLDHPFSQQKAVDVGQSATAVFSLLEDAVALPTVLTQITAAIRVYERDVLRQVTWQA